MLNRSDGEFIRRHFQLPRRGDPWGLARLQGLWQADIVLALLNAGRRQSAERLMGRPITVCPPDPRIRPIYSIGRTPQQCAAGPRVVRVGRNPRLPTTDAFQRFKLFRVGLTVPQLLARGLSRRDIRINRQQGHVEFSE